MGRYKLNSDQIDAYQAEGVVLLKGLLKDWVSEIASGIDSNLSSPGPYAAENLNDGEAGRFFDDYCNWTRIAEFENVIRHSQVASVAAQLMDSNVAQLFHEHVLVKEPGTAKATPWHQDSPYYFVDGIQNVSFWCPIDPVQQASLRCVAGSHLWDKPVLPVKWLAEDNFYDDEDAFQAVPDPEAEKMPVREWQMEPGDVVAFHYRTLHGARGNNTKQRRRAFSIRFVGDDARYITRPGKTSPPFPGHKMQDGDRLREDWFPIIYNDKEAT